MPRSDEITLSRAAIRKLADNLASDAGSDAVSSHDLYDKIFYWTAMHESGHWLGVDNHDEKHSGSRSPRARMAIGTDSFVARLLLESEIRAE